METIFTGPDAWSEAFSTCREADRPMKAIIHGMTWKIFPSGRAEPGIQGIRRRRELDQELKDLGAHIIQVRDLGAALEARERGGIAIQVVTGPGWQPMPFAPTIAIRAAHLARVALGESS